MNCSDVEVNLKILLNGAVRAGEITRAARDRLLVQMTDEVAALVLRNNYLQGQAISTSEFQAKERLSENAYVIRALERSGDLNRALEFLPSDEEIAERRKAGEGLTRPELAIILSYGKIWLYRALIHSNVPEDPLSVHRAEPLFSRHPCSSASRARLKRHRLRREIIATAITNSLINRMGPVFPVRAQDDTGADPAAIARAYTHCARSVRGARHLGADRGPRQPHPGRRAVHRHVSNDAAAAAHRAIGCSRTGATNLDIERAVRATPRRWRELWRELDSVLGATATGAPERPALAPDRAARAGSARRAHRFAGDAALRARPGGGRDGRRA